MRAYERLIKYAKIHTTSSDKSGMHPSFAGEFDLARILKDEMTSLGLEQVVVDDKCYVYGILPASEGYENAVPIGFISHMDTSPDASGENVEPILHENYDGEDLALGTSGRILSKEKFPFLENLVGETLITSDGTTLLGADDKAGISEIMTALERIKEENIPHGPICICFTPDEEIGEGADFFNLSLFKAKFAYTVDGGDADDIEYENFNAAAARVKIAGVSVHPGSAKNIMVNAQNVAMEFHYMFPTEERPETTEGRKGFIHLHDSHGSVSEAELRYIIRDHDPKKFQIKKDLMHAAADWINKKYGEGTVKLEIKDSYYNMYEIIRNHPKLIVLARKAIEMAGMEPHEVPVRGGTDGARLSYMGLPCPNLGTGGFNFHGEYECTTVERMDRVTEVVLNLIKLWREFPADAEI